jgi:integrase/recombinase XerD
LTKAIGEQVGWDTAARCTQVPGGIREVALRLGHASIQTTKMHLRAYPTENLALLDAHHAPLFKPGWFELCLRTS